MNKKKIFFILFILILFMLFIFSFGSNSFAATDPKLITKIKGAFDKISGWMIKIATPAAAVAVRSWYIYEKIQFW